MWTRGLLVVGGRGDSEGRAPERLMRELGRPGFLTVLDESDAAGIRPDEKYDVALISPGCARPGAVLRACVESGMPSLVIGARHLDAGAGALLSAYRARGGSALGPGSQGFFDWEKGLALCWSRAVRVPDGRPEERHVALIAQGGTVPFALYAMAVEGGVRFRRVVSLGTCADGDAQLLRQMRLSIDDPETTLLILALESLSKGREFLNLAARAASRGLPVALLRSGADRRFLPRIARRRPDAVWTDRIMWESVAGQYGVVLLDDAQQIVDLGKLSGPSPRGNRVAVLAVSEGLAVMQGEQCLAAGLDVHDFSRALRRKVKTRLNGRGTANNPVDMTGAALNEEGVLSGVLSDALASGECDMILVTTGAMTPRQGELVARALGEARRSLTIPLACCCMSRWHPLEDMVRRMNAEGVPLFAGPKRAAEALACLWRVGRAVPAPPPGRVPREPFLRRCPPRLSERDAMALVESYGLSTVPHRFCTSVSEVLRAARELGFPLALKVVSPSFASKQQARAVALNLRTEEELRNAYGRILERVSRVHADAEVQGVFAQKMISDGVECMIGIKRDALFGPVVAVALGGAYYGLVKDISLRVAPVTLETARDMIASLKGYPLVSGRWFGRANDVEALARQIVVLSRMACAEPDIEELDINPVFIRPEGLGAEIADAFAVRRVPAAGAEDRTEGERMMEMRQ